MMGRLIQAEFLKLSKLKSYKILVFGLAGAGVLTSCIFAFLPADGVPPGINLQDGYHIYISLLADSEVFMGFSIIFTVLFVNTEFYNRTFSGSLFSGCSRRSILLAKAIVFLLGLIPVAFAVPLMAGVTGSISLGLGVVNASMWQTLIQTTLLAILGNAALGGVCLLIAVSVKNIAGTIGVGFGLMIIMETMKMFSGTERMIEMISLYQTGSLLQPGYIMMSIIMNSTILVLTLIASIVIFQRSDLK